jgi:hypothetical protein
MTEIKEGKEKSKITNFPWDVILVAFSMLIAFLIVVMKLTDVWPCNILEITNINPISCQQTVSENLNLIINHVRDSIFNAFS